MRHVSCIEIYTTDGERWHDALTQVKSVNHTDVNVLATTFPTVADLFLASAEELSAIPGLGPKKVQRLYEAFNAPILATSVQVAPKTLTTASSSNVICGTVRPGRVTALPSIAAATAAAAGVIDLDEIYDG
jgi:hypothetical protein